MLEPLGFDTLALLMLAAFAAGFFDAIAGGGGLISVPALALAGLDPVAAVATNKVNATFGTFASTYAFARAGHLPWRALWPVFLIAACGGVLGSWALPYVPRDVLSGALPVVLVLVALYFAFSPRLSAEGGRPRIGNVALLATVVPLVGFYDGVFGPGAGSFYMIGFVALRGLGVMAATARTKLANFGSNAASLAGDALGGAILWKVGLAMGVAQYAGSRLGARAAMLAGARLVRPLIVLVCCAPALRLALDPANPLRTLLAG